MKLFSALPHTLVVMSLLAGAARAEAGFTVESWPEADRLFQQDNRWTGGAGAASINLGDGFSMWLFSDCALATRGKRGRRTTKIDNAIAIQDGSDPTTAALEFIWRESAGAPTAFFPRDEKTRYLPTHGVLLDDRVLVFMTSVVGAEGTPGAVVGWSAAVMMRHGGQWRTQLLNVPESHPDIIMGAGSTLLVGSYVYAFGVRADAVEGKAANSASVARWLASDAAFGDLSHMQWWTGETHGWVEHTAIEAVPVEVIGTVRTEFTVHYQRKLSRFLLVEGGMETPRDGTRLSWWSSEYLNNKWQRGATGARDADFDAKSAFPAMVHPQLAGADLVLTRVDDRGVTRFYRVNVMP